MDNTFSSPYLQTPLDLGADVVLESITKFINGHADVVGGIVVTKDPDLYKQLRKAMVNTGCNMDPHQAFLVLRGVKTLGIRVDALKRTQCKSRAGSSISPRLHRFATSDWSLIRSIVSLRNR